MKKRLLNLFLALVLVAFVVPMAANAATKCSTTHNKAHTTYVAPKDATCTEPGNIEHWVCEECKVTFVSAGPSSLTKKTNVSIAANGHTEVSKAGTPATCVQDGETDGTWCSVCETTLSGRDRIPATGKHDYKLNFWAEEGKEATCTESAIGVFKCEVCGDYENITVAALGHDYPEEGKITRQPTCTKYGLEKFECSRCDANYTERIDKLPHTEVPKAGTPATCGQDGETDGTWCSVCETTLSGRDRIPATGKHDYKLNFWAEEGKEATCTESAIGVFKCEVCGDYENITVAALGHDYPAEGKITRQPTCTKYGLEKFECSRCDANYTKNIAKLAHSYVETAKVPATCIKDGVEAGKECSVCGDKVGFEVIPATGKHSYTDEDGWITEPTCTAGGVKKLGCPTCNRYREVPVEALGHDKDITVLKEATCTIKGMAFHQCKREGCGYWKYVDIPKLGHNKVVVPAVEPSCTATGLTAGEKCDRCGETFKAQSVVDKLAHAWKDVEAKAATCQEDGYNAHRACANCGETDGMTVIPANNTGHNYVNNKCTICGEYDPAHEHQGTGTVTTDSTCTTKGVKSFSCSGCDYTWTEDIAKKAHSYGADDRCTVCQKLNSKHEHSYAQTDYREPTCDIGGQVTKQCSVCGDTTQTTINALGHSYSNGRCIRCGTAATCTHSTTNTTVTREATCRQAGRKVTTCTGCGKVMGTETIPATGNHNYVNDYCTGCGQVDPYKKTADNQDVYPLG